MANLDGMEIAHGERLLAQRSIGWKLVCSVWVLIVGVGFVFFSIIGWALAAVLSRSKKMWVLTLVWGALYAVALVAILGTDSDLGVVPFITIWIGSVAHAAYLSRAVLRARAVALATDQAWRTGPEGLPTVPAMPPAPPQPDMPTIPLPDGVAPQNRDLRDS